MYPFDDYGDDRNSRFGKVTIDMSEYKRMKKNNYLLESLISENEDELSDLIMYNELYDETYNY